MCENSRHILSHHFLPPSCPPCPCRILTRAGTEPPRSCTMQCTVGDKGAIFRNTDFSCMSSFLKFLTFLLLSCHRPHIAHVRFGFLVEFYPILMYKNHFCSLKTEGVTKHILATNIFPMTPCSVKAKDVVHCAMYNQLGPSFSGKP